MVKKKFKIKPIHIVFGLLFLYILNTGIGRESLVCESNAPASLSEWESIVPTLNWSFPYATKQYPYGVIERTTLNFIAQNTLIKGTHALKIQGPYESWDPDNQISHMLLFTVIENDNSGSSVLETEKRCDTGIYEGENTMLILLDNQFDYVPFSKITNGIEIYRGDAIETTGDMWSVVLWCENDLQYFIHSPKEVADSTLDSYFDEFYTCSSEETPQTTQPNSYIFYIIGGIFLFFIMILIGGIN